MTWRETTRARQASFRGVQFELRSSEHAGGRRHARHGYPGRDIPEYEDLGKADQVFRVEGYVAGDDYLERRDELLEALNAPGDGGTLVHPHHGVLRVFVRGYTQRDDVQAGGVAFFSIDFVEIAERAITVYRTPVPSEDIDAAASALEDAAGEELREGLVTELVPQVARDATATELTKLGVLLEGLDAFSGLEDDVAEYQRKINGLLTSAASLATSPAETATAIIGAVGSVIDTAQNASRAFNAYEVLIEQISADRHLGSSKTSSNARSNAGLTTNLARTAAIAGAARAAAQIAWPSLEEALLARERLLVRIDQGQEEATDMSYAALSELRAQVVTNIPPAAGKLPRVERFELGEWVPALVLAHRLYNDAGRAEELWERNAAANPVFMPSGVKLQALVLE